MKLIEQESIGLALRFGWGRLAGYLRRRWLVTGLAITIAVYVDWKISMAMVYVVYVAGAAIPAMIYLAGQRAGSRLADISALGFLFLVLTFATQLTGISKIGPATSDGRYLVSTALAVVINWIAVKFSAGIPMYLMQPKSSFFSACSASWRFVRGGTWWRFLLVRFAGEIPFLGVYAIAYAERGALIRAGAFFSVVVVVQMLAVVGRAWSALATVAIISTAPVLEPQSIGLIAPQCS